MMPRDQLKKAVVALLDSLAEEHPLGHQDSKAARYVLTTPGGARIELMFEKNEEAPANLWCLAKAAEPLANGSLHVSPSPAGIVHARTNDAGATLYGRHSSLEHMPQLGSADLIRFRMETLADAGTILDHLLSLTPSDLK